MDAKYIISSSQVCIEELDKIRIQGLIHAKEILPAHCIEKKFLKIFFKVMENNFSPRKNFLLVENNFKICLGFVKNKLWLDRSSRNPRRFTRGRPLPT